MIIASVVSAVQMLINAYAFGMYQSLGIFIPLIVTNCIVVGRAEAFAAKKGPALSALDGFSIGMGSLREIIGNGTLFDGADALLGSWAKVLRVEIFHTDSPFLLAMLPAVPLFQQFLYDHLFLRRGIAAWEIPCQYIAF